MSCDSIRLVVLLIAILASSVSRLFAEIRPTHTIRDLTIEADAIVIAEPVDAMPEVMPHRYIVREVLQASDIAVGDEVLLRAEVLPELRRPRYGRNQDKTAAPLEIDKALLFIFNPRPGEPKRPDRSVRADIRALATSGETLVPQQPLTTSDPLHMLPREGARWEDLIAKVREELPEVNRVKAMRAIANPKDRNQALLEWVELHKAEFGGGRFEAMPDGWAGFEHKLFDWVFESCIPEDCWRAVELSMEVHSTARVDAPSFCSPEGRKLLMAKVMDEQVARPLRREALELLSYSCFRSRRDDFPSVVIATPEEQVEIIDKVTPLLAHEDSRWRIAAIRCLQGASWPGDGNLRHLETKRAVPALAKMYATERDARVREQLADTLRRLEDEFFWKQLSGNPRGMVVIARVRENRPGELEFEVSMRHTRTQRTLPPVMMLEQRDERREVVRTALVQPIVRSTKNRAGQDVSTWIEQGVLTVPVDQIGEGEWRVTFEGQTDEGEPWRSEPLEISIPAK